MMVDSLAREGVRSPGPRAAGPRRRSFCRAPCFRSRACLFFCPRPLHPSPFPHPPPPRPARLPVRFPANTHLAHTTPYSHTEAHTLFSSLPLARSCPLELRPPLLGSPLSTLPSRLTRLHTSTQMTHKHGIARRGPHRQAARGYQLTEDFGPSSTPGAFSRLLPFRG